MSSPLQSVSAGRAADQDAVRARRAGRWAARSVLWRVTTHKRIRNCGRAVVGGAAIIKVSTDAAGVRSAGVGGVATCGSVHACPVCSARVAAERSAKISEILRRWRDAGGQSVMITLTVRHHAGQSLETVWNAVGKAWRAASHGKAWDAAQAVYGTMMTSRGRETARVPLIRVVEATHGRSGWHVHVHAIALVNGDVSDLDAEFIGSAMWGRWNQAAQRAGMNSGDARVGFEAHLVRGDASDELAEYWTKQLYNPRTPEQLAAAEATLGQFKTAQGQNRTPFGLLAELVEDEAGVTPLAPEQKAATLALWREWERVSHGKRQITLSHGLLEAVGMVGDEWRTDEEIADDTLDGQVEATICPDVWRVLCSMGMVPGLLDAFERSSKAGREILDVAEQWVSRRPPRARG